jgi:hypothetical protein
MDTDDSPYTRSLYPFEYQKTVPAEIEEPLETTGQKTSETSPDELSIESWTSEFSAAAPTQSVHMNAG